MIHIWSLLRVPMDWPVVDLLHIRISADIMFLDIPLRSGDDRILVCQETSDFNTDVTSIPGGIQGRHCAIVRWIAASRTVGILPPKD